MSPSIAQIDRVTIDALFDFHLSILKRLLQGHSSEAVVQSESVNVERFNYLELAKTFSFLSFDDHGRLRAAYPVSPNKTDTVITVSGVGTGYAMCAIDALGTAFLFDAVTVIEAVDPVSKNAIRIIIDPDDIDLTPYANIRITVPSAKAIKEDADGIDQSTAICPLIGFFESADTVPAEQSRVVDVISFDQAFVIGRNSFDATHMREQLQTVLQAISSLYPSRLVPGEEFAETVLAISGNPAFEALGLDRAQEMILQQVQAKGLLQKSQRFGSQKDHYELSAKGRRIIETLTPR